MDVLEKMCVYVCVCVLCFIVQHFVPVEIFDIVGWIYSKILAFSAVSLNRPDLTASFSLWHCLFI